MQISFSGCRVLILLMSPLLLLVNRPSSLIRVKFLFNEGVNRLNSFLFGNESVKFTSEPQSKATVSDKKQRAV